MESGIDEWHIIYAAARINFSIKNGDRMNRLFDYRRSFFYLLNESVVFISKVRYVIKKSLYNYFYPHFHFQLSTFHSYLVLTEKCLKNIFREHLYIIKPKNARRDLLSPLSVLRPQVLTEKSSLEDFS